MGTEVASTSKEHGGLLLLCFPCLNVVSVHAKLKTLIGRPNLLTSVYKNVQFFGSHLPSSRNARCVWNRGPNSCQSGETSGLPTILTTQSIAPTCDTMSNLEKSKVNAAAVDDDEPDDW